MGLKLAIVNDIISSINVVQISPISYRNTWNRLNVIFLSYTDHSGQTKITAIGISMNYRWPFILNLISLVREILTWYVWCRRRGEEFNRIKEIPSIVGPNQKEIEQFNTVETSNYFQTNILDICNDIELSIVIGRHSLKPTFVLPNERDWFRRFLRETQRVQLKRRSRRGRSSFFLSTRSADCFVYALE